MQYCGMKFFLSLDFINALKINYDRHKKNRLSWAPSLLRPWVVRSSFPRYDAAEPDSHCRNSKILTDFETGMCQNQTVTSQMRFYNLTPALADSGSGSRQKLVLHLHKNPSLVQNEGQLKKKKWKKMAVKTVTWWLQMNLCTFSEPSL